MENWHVFDTAGGACGIAWAGGAVTRFQLPAQSRAGTERLIARRRPAAAPGVPTPEIVAVTAMVRRYFDGEPVDFGPVPVVFDAEVPPFFAAIYTALRQVPWGASTTYGALAAALGSGAEAARDVGQAMARNPVPLIIPCHRVLAAGGRVGGFSAPGGAVAKMRMLALEGVKLAPAAPAQGSFGF